MEKGALGISQQWRNSTFRLPLTLRLPNDFKKIKGGGGGAYIFISFPSNLARLVPCSQLPPVPAVARVFVAVTPIAAEPSSTGAAAPAHCRHHQSRAPVVSPLSVPCTRAPMIRALSLLPSASPPCARVVHCHS